MRHSTMHTRPRPTLARLRPLLTGLLWGLLLCLWGMMGGEAYGATFLTDTFGASGGSGNSAGTDLSAHTPDLGGAWSRQTGFASSNAVLTASHTLRGNAVSGVGSVYINAVTPTASASNDDTAAFNLIVSSSVPTGNSLGVIFRADSTGFYFVRCNPAGGSCDVYRVDTTSTPAFSSVGNVNVGLIAAGTHTVTFRCLNVSGNPTFSMTLDGTPKSTAADSTASKRTARGGVGIWEQEPSTDSTGLQMSGLSFYSDGTPSGLGSATPIGVTNTAFYFSPENWYSDGSGTIQSNNIKPSSTYAVSAYPGAYIKTQFSGTSFSLAIDVSAMSGLSATYYPRYRYSVDGGAWSADTITVSGQTAVAVAGLPNATTGSPHSLLFEFQGGGGGTVSSPDRWNTPQQGFKVTSITLDAGASLVAPAVLPKIMLTTGDSTWEGVRVNGVTGAQTDQDAFASPGCQIAQAFGCEWGNCSLGGGGWTVTGSGNVPPYFTPGNDSLSWWNKYGAGHSRLDGSGHLMPIPDYWLQGYGINDGLQGTTDAAVTASVQGWLSAARAAAPGCKIALYVPAGGQKRTAITAAYNAYKTASPSDTLVYLIDPSPPWGSLIAQFGTPSAYALDGLHPTVAADALLGSLDTALLRAATVTRTRGSRPAYKGGH